MDPAIYINEVVDVVVVFNHKNSRTICLPIRIKYQNKNIDLIELGLRHPTRKGSRSIHIFDMSDGQNDYRLEFDSESLLWKLIAITNTNYYV